ncbi:MAG: HNH endonuclease [Flavobacteriales bacterium]
MNTFIFLWNPNRWNWDSLEQDIERLDRTGTWSLRWSCVNLSSVKPGDRIFLLKLGTEPKGLVAAGIAATAPYRAQHWGEEERVALYTSVDFEVILNPDKDPILTVETLRLRSVLKNQNWSPQSSNSVKPELVEELEAAWFEFLTTHKIRFNPFSPAVSAVQDTYPEGTPNQVFVTTYERNPHARKVCLTHYGYSCVVCNFNFQEVYGDVGKEFIHVHHLTQLSTQGANDCDPIKDLRPVCPNCHSMIHRRTDAYGIDEVKGFISGGH